MGTQSAAFIAGEGQAWLERNRSRLKPEGDPILEMIESAGLSPTRVVEIGCADGWRLREINKRYGSICRGIDPGASHSGDGESVLLAAGVADQLWRFVSIEFDLVIYGFCLYLCDPADYFQIAKEGDRALADGGHIIIWDFYSPSPYRKPYHHKEGIWSHKMDFSKLWLWNPAYSLANARFTGEDDNCTAVHLLKKNTHKAFPVRG